MLWMIIPGFVDAILVSRDSKPILYFTVIRESDRLYAYRINDSLRPLRPELESAIHVRERSQ